MGVKKGGSKPFVLFVYFVVHVIALFTISILEREKQGIFMPQKPRANTWVRPYIPANSRNPEMHLSLFLGHFSNLNFEVVLHFLLVVVGPA